MIFMLITAVLFGALHLPTYQWNLFQCLVIIGVTRIPFTIATLKSNSMVSGVIAHYQQPLLQLHLHLIIQSMSM